ncbi:MAG: LacI family DNA-binding transcriptional regulator [Candidatus Eiseniibacteriota bacterium]
MVCAGAGMTEQSTGKATLQDVARMAGVSVTTVSRVLNNPGLVARDKQSAVLRSLESLDYIPNQLARSLVQKRSKAIGLVVPTISNPVFAPTIAAIERELELAGYALLIHCCERDPKREFKQIRTLVERGVDGLIVTGSVHEPGLAEFLARTKIPYLNQDISLHLPMGPSIALDNAGAMACAVDHLVALGHRDIAVVTGPTHNTPPIDERFKGAIGQLERHALPVKPDWLIVTQDYESGPVRDGARRLLSQPMRPTAVVCTGDILALGLVAECRALGLGVPGDLSIVGCGDTDMGRYVDPPLTTVFMPFAEMGAVAAQSLLSLIAGDPVDALRVLPFELIERASAAAPG